MYLLSINIAIDGSDSSKLFSRIGITFQQIYNQSHALFIGLFNTKKRLDYPLVRVSDVFRNYTVPKSARRDLNKIEETPKPIKIIKGDEGNLYRTARRSIGVLKE